MPGTANREENGMNGIIRAWHWRWRSRNLPTDLEILSAIWNRYYDEFTSYGSSNAPIRRTKNYVPVDAATIAKDLGAEPDIVFGRLYYYLEHQHAYTTGEWREGPSVYERHRRGPVVRPCPVPRVSPRSTPVRAQEVQRDALDVRRCSYPFADRAVPAVKSEVRGQADVRRFMR